MRDDPLFLLGTLIIALCAIPANGIVWTYRRVSWRKSRLGRVMFTKSFALALALDFALVGAAVIWLDLGRPGWFEALRLITYGVVCYALWAQWKAYRDLLDEDMDGHTFR